MLVLCHPERRAKPGAEGSMIAFTQILRLRNLSIAPLRMTGLW